MGPVLPIAERMLRETSGIGAPWTIVESTDSRYRDLTVARTILAALTARLNEQTAHTARPLAESVFGDFNAEANVLSGIDLSQSLTRGEYRAQLAKEQAKLKGALAGGPPAGVTTVLAFEGWDAAGKGGVIRRITGAMEAGDYQVIPVAAPTEEERRYHYMWRFWRDLPLAGKVVIFDRTWYGRVLVERLEGFATPAEWQRAFDEINDFEAQMVEQGYYVGKFWLHISPDEQLARFKARRRPPTRATRSPGRTTATANGGTITSKAVDQMVLRTTSDRARWSVLPANDKHFARVAALRQINKGLARTLGKG